MGLTSSATTYSASFTTEAWHSYSALNSSANYLGGAIGSVLGGMAMLAGLAPSQPPLAAGSLTLVALLIQLAVFLNQGKTELHSG